MEEFELLKRISKEHYTVHDGKLIKVEEIIKKLYEKNTSNGTARSRKNNTFT